VLPVTHPHIKAERSNRAKSVYFDVSKVKVSPFDVLDGDVNSLDVNVGQGQLGSVSAVRVYVKV